MAHVARLTRMGFLEDAEARNRENASRQSTPQPPPDPHRPVQYFADLALLCSRHNVQSLELMTLVGERPTRNGLRGWMVEHRPDQHIAFDENGLVWERAEMLVETYQKFWGGHRYVHLIAVFAPHTGNGAMRSTRGFETLSIDLREVGVAAGAVVLAGQATVGVIPLNAVDKQHQREDYGYNA